MIFLMKRAGLQKVKSRNRSKSSRIISLLIFNSMRRPSKRHCINAAIIPGHKSQEELSIEDAMMAHKDQYKSEHINSRAKSGFKLEPVYIHTPNGLKPICSFSKLLSSS